MIFTIKRGNPYRMPLILNLIVLVAYDISVLIQLGYPFSFRLVFYINIFVVVTSAMYILSYLLTRKYVAVGKHFVLTGLFVGIPVISLLLNSGMSVSALYDICEWPFLFLMMGIAASSKSRDYRNIKAMALITIITLLPFCLILTYEFWAGHTLSGRTIRPVYFLFSMMPLLFIAVEKRTAYVLMAIVTVFLLISTKRAGIAACVMGFIVYLLADAFVTGNSIRNRWKKYVRFILICTFLLAIFVYIDSRLGLGILERFTQLPEDEGSGRYTMWHMMMSRIQNRSVLRNIIGSGYHAVSNDFTFFSTNTSILAHNDIMEYLYDYGIIGFLLLIYLYIDIARLTFKFIKSKHQLLPVYAMFVVMFFCVSLFSYGIVQPTTINGLMMFYGVILAQYSMEKRLR